MIPAEAKGEKIWSYFPCDSGGKSEGDDPQLISDSQVAFCFQSQTHVPERKPNG